MTKQLNSMTLEQIANELPFNLDNLDLLPQDITIAKFFFPIVRQYAIEKNINIRTIQFEDNKQTLNPIKVNVEVLNSDRIRIVIHYATNLIPFISAQDCLIKGIPFIIHQLKKHEERNTATKDKKWTDAINKNMRLSPKTIGKEIAKYGLKLVDHDGNDKAKAYFNVEIINNDLGKSLTKNIETLFPNDAIVSTTITGEEIKNRTPKPPKHSVTNYVLVCECKAKLTIPKEDFNDLQIEDFIKDTVCICGGGFVDNTPTIDKPYLNLVDAIYGNNEQTTEETNK
jgi:hypothetical protein